MAKFTVLYQPEVGDLTEHDIDLEGWDETNWKDDENDDLYDDLVAAFKLQYPDLQFDYIEDWWPTSLNFSHLDSE